MDEFWDRIELLVQTGRDPWHLLAALASEQHGLVAVWQARLLGLARKTIADEAAERGWTRVDHGIYLMPGSQLPPLAQIKAVELSLGQSGLAAANTALFVLGACPRPDRPLEFIVPPSSSRTAKRARVRRHKALAGDPRHAARELGVVRRGTLVAPPPLAIVTLGRLESPTTIAERIATAHRLRLCTPRAVASCLEALKPFPNWRAVHEALERIDRELVHSAKERLAREILRREGLRPYPWPYTVEHDGRMIAEVDIPFLAEKTAIFVDGPHHFADAEQRRADEDQRLALRRIGWEIIVADETRIERQPSVFIRQVRAALETRAATLPNT